MSDPKNSSAQSERLAPSDLKIEARHHEWLRSALLLIAIWAGIYLPTLGTLELKGEEGRRILPGQTMLRTGDWIVPEIGGEDYTRKPPGINWLAALSFKFTGVQNEWTARLPSVLGVLALVLATFFLGKPWLGYGGSFAAAVFVMTNIGMMEKGRLLEIDALYSVTTGLAILLWLRGWFTGQTWWTWIGIGLIMAGGWLLKGPLQYLFFYLTVGAILWQVREWRRLLHPAHFLSLLITGGLVALWWIPFQTQTAGEGARMLSQLTNRMDGSDFHLTGWLLNIPRGLSNLLPWVVFLPLAWFPLRADVPEKVAMLIRGLRWGVLIAFLGVSLAPGSLPRYTMPLTLPIFGLFALVLRWAVVPENVWKIWRLATGGGVGGLKTLAQRSGILMVILVALYSFLIVPQLKKRSLWRVAGQDISRLIPGGDTLYAVDPGSQPVFFYVTAPTTFIDRVENLPPQARFVMARGKTIRELREKHPGFQQIFSYKDRGGKESIIGDLQGP